MTSIINPNEDTRIGAGSQVALHFSVQLEEGVQIDNTRSFAEPVTLTVGDGNLLPGFEAALLGLRAGDRRTVHLPPEDAFGLWNADNVQQFDTVLFAKTEQVPQVGMLLEFEDKGKNSLAGVVKAVHADTVEVDFNHPLAGKNIVFEVEIFKVTPPDQQGIQLK